MDIETRYMENLPSPNYKTRQFERTVRQTIPEDSTKEVIWETAKKQQTIVESLVKRDIEKCITENK